MNYDKEFLSVFNEYYPFERYIVKEPKPIGNLFDDAFLTEIFVPETEIKPIFNSNGSFSRYTRINDDEIYVKIKGPAGEMRFGYYDFEEHIRLEIINIIVEDLGKYEYKCLYVDYEDIEDLKNALVEQRNLIIKKYGECTIKKDMGERYDF